MAKVKLETTMELGGHYSPAVYSYRKEIHPAYMALTVRAAINRTLARRGEVVVADWDESHAFLMPPRDSLTLLNVALKPVWDFGPWSEQYYSRVTIYPLTVDGFA